MKKTVTLIFAGAALWMTACSSDNDNSDEKAALTTEQEIEKVNAANQQTEERIEEFEKKTADLQSEVDSLLNQINKN